MGETLTQRNFKSVTINEDENLVPGKQQTLYLRVPNGYALKQSPASTIVPPEKLPRKETPKSPNFTNLFSPKFNQQEKKNCFSSTQKKKFAQYQSLIIDEEFKQPAPFTFKTDDVHNVPNSAQKQYYKNLSPPPEQRGADTLKENRSFDDKFKNKAISI